MEYRIPEYFEQFHCTAAECEDTCCAGWAIMIDEDSLKNYEKMQGDFGNRVKNSINWEKGSFCQFNKRCAFLNERNLCDLHIEAGEDMLCDTCKNYPRHMEEYEGLREGSLSLSCIEAAKIILGQKEPVRFYTMEDDVEDEEYEDFDYLLFTKLMDARECMIGTLQNRNIDVMTRIGMALELTQKMQQAIDQNEIYQIDDMLETFGSMDSMIEFQGRAEGCRFGENEYCSTMRKLFRTFYKMEVLNADWPDLVKRAEVFLYADGQSRYEELRQRFQLDVGLKSQSYETWSCWLEQLMVYYVFTYFCGAVYDGAILSKMQMIVVLVLLTIELSIAKWIEQGETLTFTEFVDIAHRVSREIEHSDVNIRRLEKLCEKTPTLQAEKLIQLLTYC